MVRRWVALRRPGTPRERRYARLPADVAQLAQPRSRSFVYAVGGGNAPEDARIRHLLEVLKVNDEMWDFCTTRFDAALAQAVSVPDAERKAYVMARSCSRTAAALPGASRSPGTRCSMESLSSWQNCARAHWSRESSSRRASAPTGGTTTPASATVPRRRRMCVLPSMWRCRP